MSALFHCPYFFISTRYSAVQHSLHPPLQCEVGNSICSIREPLEIYLPSQHAAALEMVKQIHTHTVQLHTRSRYLRSEIINANRAAADKECGAKQTKGQVLLIQYKQNLERYVRRGKNIFVLNQNIYSSLSMYIAFHLNPSENI